MKRILLLLLYILTVSLADPSQDAKALVAFVKTLDTNRDALGWNTSEEDPCAWSGVACSRENRVIGLSLAGKYLHGHIPPEFGLLTELQHLNLSFTNLTGTIPPELGLCSKLEILDLGNNSIGGAIPDTFGRLSSLRVLSLQENDLIGRIPPSLGDCSNLEVLHIFDNSFNGSIPPEVGRLQKLRIFRGGGNAGITGPIPPELGNCTSLVLLGLACTSITGQIPSSLGRLQNLQSLLLYGTGLSGSIPEEICNCTSLQNLDLFQNRLTGPIPFNLGQLTGLRSLLLWQNRLTGNIPPSIGNCKSLKDIDISNNSLSGSIPGEIGQLSQLHSFLVSINNLTGPIPAEIGDCTELTILELDTNKLSGRLPETIGKLSKLQLLFSWENELEGPIPESIVNCTQLTTVDLSENLLTGPIPAGTLSLPFLERLLLLKNQLSGELPQVVLSGPSSLARFRVSDNKLVGRIPPSLGRLWNLTFLDLEGNFLVGEIPEEIGNLGSLQSLNLQRNRLGGSIPHSIGRLKALQSLDASCNVLEGPIPPEMGDMQALEHLKLSNNALTGRIPDDIGRCKQLLSLELSNNQLSGEIPPALGSLVSLSITLDLHSNSLTGTIPQTFADLTHLVRLDLSDNKLSGSLEYLEHMTNLNVLNISHNSFSGSFMITDATVDSRDNPKLCVAQRGASQCGKNGRNGNQRRQIKPPIVIALLFAGTALVVLTGSVLLYRRCRSFSDEDGSWLWQMKSYQKWNISASDVVESFGKAVPIGKGSSGSVYRAQLPDGNEIAIKEIDFKRAHANFASFNSEVHTLGSKVRHKNIVRLIGYCTNAKSALLLYDFKSNGNLDEFLHDADRQRCLDWELRYKIALGAAQGISYLHHDCNPPILHRDIKANNILLGDAMEPYIADFGLAKVLAEEDFTYPEKIPGTTGYIAPEYSCRVKITTKSDVYSYGVVLLEILTGRRALEQDQNVVDWVHDFMKPQQQQVEVDVEALDSQLRGMADPFINEMLQCLGIAMMCVKPSPSERPSMKEVVAFLEHIKLAPEEVAHKNKSQSGSSEQRVHLLEESSERKKGGRLVINPKLLMQLQKQSSSSSHHYSGFQLSDIMDTSTQY